MKRKKPTPASTRRYLDMQDLQRAVIEANEERQRVKSLAMQLQDDVIVLHQQIETLQAQIVGVLRRPRL